MAEICHYNLFNKKYNSLNVSFYRELHATGALNKTNKHRDPQ